MVYSGLEFSTTGTFTTANNVVTATSPVQVGVNPAKGAIFTPLLQLDKGVDFTTTDKTGTFTTTGTVSGLAGSDTLQLLDDQMHTFTAPGLLATSYYTLPSSDTNSPHLVVGGGMLAVSALHLTASELDLQGTISISHVAGLTVAVQNNTHVVMNGDGASISGPDPTVTGPDTFTKDGVTLSVMNLDVHVDPATNALDISGQGSVTIGGNTLGLTLGNTTTPGLVFANGDLQSLLATVTPPTGDSGTQFMVKGLSFTLNSATFSYDSTTASFGIGADATFMAGDQSVEVKLGDSGMPGIVITNGALASLDGSVTTDLKIHGVSIKTEDLAVHYVPNSDLSITGQASFEFDGQKIELALGSTGADGTSYPGIDIDPTTGQVMSLDAGISTDITVGDLTFKADDIGVHYAPGQDFMIQGKAEFDLKDKNSSSPDQMVTVMLGSTDANGSYPGIDLDSNGNLVSLDAAITTDITVSGLEIKADGLGIMYEAANSPMNQSPTPAFVVIGGASYTLDDHTVSENNRRTFIPGLDIQNGQLQSFQASVSGDFNLLGVDITATNLSVAYVAPSSNGNGEQIAVFGEVSVSSSVFNFDTTLGDEADPGILVVNGQLQNLNITVSGGFSYDGISFAADGLKIHYNSGVNQLELSGGLMVELTSSFEVSAKITKGGLLIDPTTGALSLDTQNGFTLMASATLGPVSITNFMISFSNGTNGINFSASGDVMLPDNISINLIKLDIVNGQLADIGVGISAQIPIGDTGFFFDSLSGEIDNINNPSQLVVSATAEVSFGEKVSVPSIPGIFQGGSFALVDATGSITVSASELQLSGEVSLLGGLLGQGSASIDLNFGTGVYTVSGSFSMYDGIINFSGSLVITNQGDISLLATASVNIPQVIPFIGGTSLANVNFALNYIPGDYTDSYVAAWTSVNLFFTSFTIGFKIDFQGDFSLLDGDGVNNITSSIMTSNPQPKQYVYAQNVNIDEPNATGAQVTVTSPSFFDYGYAEQAGNDTVSGNEAGGNQYGAFTSYQLSHSNVILPSLTFQVINTSYGQSTFLGTASFDKNGNFQFASSGNSSLIPTGASVSSTGLIYLDWPYDPVQTEIITNSYVASNAYFEVLQQTPSGPVPVNSYTIDPEQTPNYGTASAGASDTVYMDTVNVLLPTNNGGNFSTTYTLTHGDPVKPSLSFNVYSGNTVLGTSNTLIGQGSFDKDGNFKFVPNGSPAAVPLYALVNDNTITLVWSADPGATYITALYNSQIDRVIHIDFNKDVTLTPGGDYGQYVVQLVTSAPLYPGTEPTFAQSTQYLPPTVNFLYAPGVNKTGVVGGTLLANVYTPESQQPGDMSTSVALYYTDTNAEPNGRPIDGHLIGTYPYSDFTQSGDGSPASYIFSFPGFQDLKAGTNYFYATISDGQSPVQYSPISTPLTANSTPTLSAPSFLNLTSNGNGGEQGVFSAAAGNPLKVTAPYSGDAVTIEASVSGGGSLTVAGQAPTMDFKQTYDSAAAATAALDVLTFVSDNTFTVGTTLTFSASVTTLSGKTLTATQSIPLLIPNTHLLVTQTESGTLSAVTLTNGGSGYQFAPTVTFTSADGNGSGATGVATIQNGQVVDVTITSTGVGYDEPPLLSFSGGNPTTPATATDAIVAPPTDPNSVFLTITVTNPGGLDAQDGTNVQVQNYLTPGLTVLSSSASEGSFDPTTGLWTIGNLAIGAPAVTLALTVQAGPNTFDTPLTSTASASSTLINYPAADAQNVANILPLANTIVVSPLTLPPGYTNSPYTLALSADRGGGGPYTYALDTAIQTDYSGFLPLGLTLSSNGVLSGQPLYVGTFDFSVIVTNKYGASTTVPLELNVANDALWLTGTSYTLNLDNTPGSSYFVKYGTLPPGMNIVIDSTGEGMVTGMPATPGYYNFTISESVNGAHYGIFQYSITVEAPVSLTPETLPAAAVGSNYSEQLTAAGGSGIYTFSTTNLPAGLTLSATGLLSGTISPDATPGTTSFTVTVADTLAVSASVTYNFTIEPAVLVPLEAFAVPPATVPPATIGSPYSQTLAPSDGGTGYTFALTSGTLPAGLTLAANGILSGTIPVGTLISNASFVVTATDSTGATLVQTFSLAVNPAIVISPSDLADGAATGAYTQMLTATGGSGTGYTFAVTAGTLPAGLTLAANGLLSGTIAPTVGAGYYAFTVTATDSLADTGSVTASLFVDAAITLGPATVPDAKIGTPYMQQFTAAGGSQMGYTFAVIGGSLPAGLTLAANGLLSGTVSPSNPAGSYDFTVAVNDSAGMSSSLTESLNVDPISETWTGAVSTAWSNPANYSMHIVPGLGVNVTIPSHPTNGRCPVLDVSASVNNLTLQAGANLTLAGHGLKVNGTVVNQGTIIAEGNETVTLANGNDTKEGTWEFVGDGTGHQLMLPHFGSADYFNLLIADHHTHPDTFQTAANLVVNGNLVITCGTFAPGASVTTCGLSLSSTGLLNAPAVLSDSGNWTVTGGKFSHGTGTVIFTGATGTQTLQSGGRVFFNVTHSGAGTLLLSGAGLTVNGTLTNSAGVLQTNNQSVIVGGTTTLSGGTFRGSSAGDRFNHGLIVNGGTFTGAAGQVVAAGITILAGTLSAPTSTLSDSGDWTFTGGTFNADNGTVALTGSNQHITGSTTFHNLTKTVKTADTLTFQAGATDTITGLLTLEGIAHHLLALRSSEAGTQFDLDPLSAALASFVDVQDSANLGRRTITASHSHNSGDNQGWKFA